MNVQTIPTTDSPPGPEANTTCAECGRAYHAKRLDSSDFCGTPCRAAFNNRRAVRGAEMYDLVMALRHDRKIATALGVWKLICRIAAEHREDDIRDRDGRKSWRRPKDVIARRPYLTASKLMNGTGKGRA